MATEHQRVKRKYVEAHEALPVLEIAVLGSTAACRELKGLGLWRDNADYSYGLVLSSRLRPHRAPPVYQIAAAAAAAATVAVAVHGRQRKARLPRRQIQQFVNKHDQVRPADVQPPPRAAKRLRGVSAVVEQKQKEEPQRPPDPALPVVTNNSILAAVHVELAVYLHVADLGRLVTDYLDERVLFTMWNPRRQTYDLVQFDVFCNQLRLVQSFSEDQESILSSQISNNRLVAMFDYDTQVLRQYIGGSMDQSIDFAAWPEEDDEAEFPLQNCRPSSTRIVVLDGKLLFFVPDATWELDLESSAWTLRDKANAKDYLADGSNSLPMESNESNDLYNEKHIEIISDGHNTVYMHAPLLPTDDSDPLPMMRWDEKAMVRRRMKDLPVSAGYPESLDDWEDYDMLIWKPDTVFLLGGSAPMRDNVTSFVKMLRYDDRRESSDSSSSSRQKEGWSICADLPFPGRFLWSSAVTSDALYVFALYEHRDAVMGHKVTWDTSPTVWRYDCAEDRWHKTEVTVVTVVNSSVK